MDYADVVYDQTSNDDFYNKLETVQYNAALAITGAIKGSSHQNLYQELGLEIFNKEDAFAYFKKLFQLNYQHL